MTGDNYGNEYCKHHGRPLSRPLHGRGSFGPVGNSPKDSERDDARSPFFPYYSRFECVHAINACRSSRKEVFLLWVPFPVCVGWPWTQLNSPCGQQSTQMKILLPLSSAFVIAFRRCEKRAKNLDLDGEGSPTFFLYFVDLVNSCLSASSSSLSLLTIRSASSSLLTQVLPHSTPHHTRQLSNILGGHCNTLEISIPQNKTRNITTHESSQWVCCRSEPPCTGTRPRNTPTTFASTASSSS